MAAAYCGDRLTAAAGGYYFRMTTREHWDSVYASKGDGELSWTEAEPHASIALLAETGPVTGTRVIDVGGGTSLLAERLLDAGCAVTVLDVSAAALARARQRMGGTRRDAVRWVVADVTTAAPTDLDGPFDLWHDRAVFHFLTDPADRTHYIDLLSHTLPAGAHALIATFSPDGPKQCSGLPVQRYDATSLAAEVGSGFELLKSVSETHLTPWAKPQAFQYALFRRR
jgi:SAM-dependent methyltransferase